jgi:hypothetical protein
MCCHIWPNTAILFAVFLLSRRIDTHHCACTATLLHSNAVCRFGVKVGPPLPGVELIGQSAVVVNNMYFTFGIVRPEAGVDMAALIGVDTTSGKLKFVVNTSTVATPHPPPSHTHTHARARVRACICSHTSVS